MIKIQSIQLINHPILGNIQLDFIKNNGEIYNNIIFAGENGSGKTTMLDLFYSFSSFYPLGNANTGKKSDSEYVLDVFYSFSELNLKNNNQDTIHTAKSSYTQKLDSLSVKTIFYNAANNEVNRPDNLKSIVAQYSDTAINFNPKNITASTGTNLDEAASSEKTNENLATQITQLLIDINIADALDEQKWHSDNPEGRIPDDKRESRIRRFKNAFKTVFNDRLIFNGVKNLQVMFNKNGTDVKIGDLSSGEKQIVFRGGFLLRNQQAITGSTVLIDEPELSMHPKWQTRIFDFYKLLFTDDRKGQTSQIFMATHSDHVLKSALEKDDTLIIKLNGSSNPEYFHKNSSSHIFNSVTLAEVKWLIFDLPTTDLHIELYGELEKKGKINPTDRNLDPYITYPPIPMVYKHSIPTDRGDKTLPTYIRNFIDHPD
ncbi:MAG: AAA family ATPase, partial [Amoebophilaceae bacterium]|nr:AAA family ATPase [Amoebophilaceae bacterium]